MGVPNKSILCSLARGILCCVPATRVQSHCNVCCAANAVQQCVRQCIRESTRGTNKYHSQLFIFICIYLQILFQSIWCGFPRPAYVWCRKRGHVSSIVQPTSLAQLWYKWCAKPASFFAPPKGHCHLWHTGAKNWTLLIRAFGGLTHVNPHFVFQSTIWQMRPPATARHISQPRGSWISEPRRRKARCCATNAGSEQSRAAPRRTSQKNAKHM